MCTTLVFQLNRSQENEVAITDVAGLENDLDILKQRSENSTTTHLSERCYERTVTREDARDSHFVRTSELKVDEAIAACRAGLGEQWSKENLFGLGRSLLVSGDVTKSLQPLHEAAKMNHGSAQYLLGRLCHQELIKDPSARNRVCGAGGGDMKWYIKGLHNGNQKAIDMLRISYFDAGFAYRDAIVEAFQSVPSDYGLRVLTHLFEQYVAERKKDSTTTQYLREIEESGRAMGFSPRFNAGRPDPAPVGDDINKQRGEFITLMAATLLTVAEDDGSGGWVRDREFMLLRDRAARLLHVQDAEIRQEAALIWEFAEREFQGPGAFDALATVFTTLQIIGELMPERSYNANDYSTPQAPPMNIAEMDAWLN